MTADKDYRDHFKKTSVQTINCFDLDNYVLSPEFSHWRNGDFACAKEAGNDTWAEVEVERGINSKYLRIGTQKYIETGKDLIGYGLPDCLLSILCERGLIEPGRYFVRVSW